MDLAPRRAQQRQLGPVFLAVAMVVAALGLIGSLVGAIWAIQYNQTDVNDLAFELDLAGNRVQLEPAIPLSPEASPMASGFGQFQVPTLGLDVPLGAVNFANNRIEPPGFRAVYWLRNVGVAPDRADQGTVFVATCSLGGGGRAPGNYLMDAEQGIPMLQVGTDILVDNIKYRFTRSQLLERADLDPENIIWANLPGRLVVFNCLQRKDQKLDDKLLVVEAVRS